MSRPQSASRVPRSPRAPPQPQPQLSLTSSVPTPRPTSAKRFGAMAAREPNAAAQSGRAQAAAIVSATPLDSLQQFTIGEGARAASIAVPTAAGGATDSGGRGGSAVGGDARDMQYFFKLLGDSVVRERAALRSFAVVCESALARTRAACADLPSPNRLEVSVASMLLVHLSYAIGPSYSELMRRLLTTLFSAVFEQPGASSEIGCDGGGDSSPASVPLPDLSAPQPPASYAGFIGNRLVLEAAETLRDTNARLTMRLEQLQHVVRRSASQVTAATTRAAGSALRAAFTAWRGLVRQHAAQETRWLGMVRRARSLALQEAYFVRWRLHFQQYRDRLHVQLAFKNHALLQQRLGQLQRRCLAREEEIALQRAAKERAAERAEQLEALMAVDRAESARAKARLHATAAENATLVCLANRMYRALQRTTAPLLRGLTPAALEAEASGNAQRRAVHQRLQEEHRMATAVGPDQFAVPFFVKTGGAAHHAAHLDDVHSFLCAWANAVLRAVRDDAEQLALSPERDDGEVREHIAAVRAAPVTIADLHASLGDGRALLLLLWRVAAEERGGRFFLVRCDSDAERCALAMRMAAFYGVDGGLRPSQLVGTTGVSPKALVRLVARIFILYTEPRAATAATGLGQSGGRGGGGGGGGGAGDVPADALAALFHLHEEAAGRDERWRHLARCVDNFIAADAMTTAGDDASSAAAAHDVAGAVTLATLRDMLPAAAARFQPPPSGASSGGEGGREMEEEATAEEEKGKEEKEEEATEEEEETAEEARAYFVEELRSVLCARAELIRGAAEFYASLAAGEGAALPRGGAIDAVGWARFLLDTRLVTTRIVTKNAAELVFRMLCNQTAAHAAPQQQQHSAGAQVGGRSATIAAGLKSASHSPTPASPPRSSTLVVPAAASPGTGSIGGAASTMGSQSPGGSGGSGASEGHFMAKPLLAFAIVALFLAKHEPSPNATATAAVGLLWSNADEGVAKFKAFVATYIDSCLPAWLLEPSVIAPCNALTVQEVLKQLREPLKRVFVEFAKERGPRVRSAEFVQLWSRELKLVDAADAAQLYHALKNYFASREAPSDRGDAVSATGGAGAGRRSRANSVATTASTAPAASASAPTTVAAVGIDFHAFCIAAVAFSRTKAGSPLHSHAAALGHFLTNVVFPPFAFRLKLKF